jgi:hypothetical protein
MGQATGFCTKCGNHVSRDGHDPDCPSYPGYRLPREWGHVCLICYRAGQGSQLSFWPSVAEAMQADRDLSPCDRDCLLCHAVVYRDGGGRFRTVEMSRPVDDNNIHHELRAALRGDGLALARLRNTLKKGD